MSEESYIVEPTSSGAWHVTRKNANGTFTFVSRHHTEEEANEARSKEIARHG
jgi:hypothetical protein